MSFDYIRRAYNVPAKRGARVRYTGCGQNVEGTIKSAKNGHLMIILDGTKHTRPFHPTWEIEYLKEPS